MITTRTRDSYNLRSRSISKLHSPRSSRKPTLRQRKTTSSAAAAAAAAATGARSMGSNAPSKKDEDGYEGDGVRRAIGGKCPQRRDNEEDFRKQCTKCAQVALQHINQIQGGVVYELVDVGISTAFHVQSEHCFYVHSNFEAKPEGSTPSETILFFAELRVGHKLPMTLKNYYPLGPVSQVFTGLNGCLACGPESDDPIHHPLDRKLFYVGTEQLSLL